MSKRVKKLPPLEQLYSIPAAAEKMGGLSHWTLRKWIQLGKIKAKKVGARVMLTETSIREFLG